MTFFEFFISMRPFQYSLFNLAGITIPALFCANAIGQLPPSLFELRRDKCAAALLGGAFIAPSVYRGEPAFFVSNGEMARGVEIDKCFRNKEIKKFIFLDFWVLPPCVFCTKWRSAIALRASVFA
jgi:hypothetical protein